MLEHQEAWRAIPGFPGYEVSDRGAVRSMLASGFGPAPTAPRCLKPCNDAHGYFRVYLRRGGKTYSRKLSWLVLEAFVGPRPSKHDACHNDGIRSNDCLQNLRWDTRKANLADCIAHGTRLRGSQATGATLSDEHVVRIRALLSEGRSQSEIARTFSVAQTTVSKIKRGVRWGWLA